MKNATNISECPLSKRQLQVVALSAENLSTKEIAEKLGIVVGTVRLTLYNSYKKLNVHSKTEAIRAIKDGGWLNYEPEELTPSKKEPYISKKDKKKKKFRRTQFIEGCPLTKKEISVIQLLAQGKSYKQIALELDRSPSTIRHHLHTSYTKLKITDRAQAVIKCERNGWLEERQWNPDDDEVPIEGRKPDKRNQLTPAQKIYIDAFTKFLTDEHNDENVAIMEASLRLMRSERGEKLDRSPINPDEVYLRHTDMITDVAYAISGNFDENHKKQKNG